MPASPSAHSAAIRVDFGPVADQQPRTSRLTGAGPTGSTDSVIFSPAHTRFTTATRSAISRMVCVFRVGADRSVVPHAHPNRSDGQPATGQHVRGRERLANIIADHAAAVTTVVTGGTRSVQADSAPRRSASPGC